MKTKWGLLLVLLCLPGCVASRGKNEGWKILKWIDESDANGASLKMPPELRTEFVKVLSYEHNSSSDFSMVLKELREGDLIAYDMSGDESLRSIANGKFNTIGYQILDYGHLAIIVNDTGKLKLFSSQAFIGPNLREDADSLRTHSFDVFRLDQWKRVDQKRFHEFVALSQKKAWGKLGYDFSGMFGLWNSNLEPNEVNEIGGDYICSTVIVAALHYSGVRVDAIKRRGILDLVSPKQVVTSRGYLMER